MSYLLDTSSFLWFASDDTGLSRQAKVILEDPNSNIYLSLVSVWELAIKPNLGRGFNLPRPFVAFIDAQLQEARFKILGINIDHIKRVADLPLIHRDPFDRLPITQCLAEDLSIITNDAAFDAYPIQRLW